ncbi:hypothetical protein HAX54_013836 [Datura stramonium]|uniref:Serine-threonine/tyrosine-protein kinase catalytic domain-containing protein n=1 Tax=Datura stramonium TaxID=4076 RepID=A0ABS8TM07_DATST|nr:hypothetical protein [Datura stramonium]
MCSAICIPGKVWSFFYATVEALTAVIHGSCLWHVSPLPSMALVVDLGLSSEMSNTNLRRCTRNSPGGSELLNGSSSLVSEKVDVFSFGIVLWELLTGEEPYAELHYGAIIGGIGSRTRLHIWVRETIGPQGLSFSFISYFLKSLHSVAKIEKECIGWMPGIEKEGTLEEAVAMGRYCLVIHGFTGKRSHPSNQISSTSGPLSVSTGCLSLSNEKDNIKVNFVLPASRPER